MFMDTLFIFIYMTLIILNCFPLGKTDTSAKSNNRLDVNGLHLKAIITQYPPFSAITRLPNNTLSYDGFNIEVINWLARALNLTISFVNEDSSEAAKSGQTQSIIHHLVNKEADIAAYLLVPSAERARVMDFSIHIAFAEFVLMVPYPEEENQLTAPFKPFNLTTWLWLTAAIMAMIVTVSLITTHYFHHNCENRRINSFASNANWSSFYAVSILLNHGYNIPHQFSRLLSIRLLTSIWCLMSLVLINYYSSSLTSYLTVPKFKPIINSLEELATKEDLKLTIEINSLLANRIMNATSGTYKSLGDSLRQNPRLLFHKVNEAIENVLKHDAAYITSWNYANFLIAQDAKENDGKCRLTRSNPVGYSPPFMFGLSRGKEINKVINKELLYLWESGLIAHWAKKYTPNADQCLLREGHKKLRPAHQHDSDVIALTRRGLSSAFVILGLGFSLALFVFLMEQIVFYYTKIRESKKISPHQHENQPLLL